jgi:Na+-transporting NADH:ubiquinone oxidoreductase subunit A
VQNPYICKTIAGAFLDDLVNDSLTYTSERQTSLRIISGSLLSGMTAEGATGYLGRYHNQVSVIAEGGDRTFLGWLSPGLHLYSHKNIFASSLFRFYQFRFNTLLRGSKRAVMPLGSYERVLPFDIHPVFLLRALIMENPEVAEQLGALELEEEDLALCSFVSAGKEDFGTYLRNVLIRLEKEG